MSHRQVLENQIMSHNDDLAELRDGLLCNYRNKKEIF